MYFLTLSLDTFATRIIFYLTYAHKSLNGNIFNNKEKYLLLQFYHFNYFDYSKGNKKLLLFVAQEKFLCAIDIVNFLAILRLVITDSAP